MTALVQRHPIAPDAAPEAALEARAVRLNARYGADAAHEILDAALNREFSGRIAVVSSFGAESAALLHLVAAVSPDAPVIFLETGKHFAQTLDYRRKLAARLGLKNVVDQHPAPENLQREDPDGDLWRRDTDACCDLRKVRPLQAALNGFDAWVTGRKQFHGGLRSALPVFEASAPFIKVNPIVRWSKDEIAAYAAKYELPPHPLVQEGFPSIGCWPCTHPARQEEDTRAGRWRGAAKTECGIHRI